MPEGSFVERTRQGQQKPATIEEDHPQQQQADAGAADAGYATENPPGGAFGRDRGAQAAGAEDPSLMLADTFTAEKSAAGRALRYRFTLRVTQAATSAQAAH